MPLWLLSQAGNLALAKQHYRRALQKCPQHFTTRSYLQLGACFMASGDAAVAADMYGTCIMAAPTAPNAVVEKMGASAAAEGGGCAEDAASVNAGTGSWFSASVAAGVWQLIPGRCASIWLKLALAYMRLGDGR